MRDLPLTLLRALAAVYETGGVRPAGRKLGIRHSAVSRSIHELEAWLDTPLFENRAGRGALHFTAEGESLARAALDSLSRLETAILKVREGARPGSVTVATLPSFAMRWLLPRLPGLNREHPHIELSIVVDQARKSPQQTGADLNIRMGPRADTDLPHLALMDDNAFPVIGRRLWTEAGRPDTREGLSGLPLLHDRDPNTSWAAWRKRFGPASLDVRRGPRLTSSDLVLRAAEQNLGIALGRGRLAADSLENGTLIRPIAELALCFPNNYWIILNPDRAHPRGGRNREGLAAGTGSFRRFVGDGVESGGGNVRLSVQQDVADRRGDLRAPGDSVLLADIVSSSNPRQKRPCSVTSSSIAGRTRSSGFT